MRLPDSMTFIDMASSGGPEVLKPARAPLPAPRGDELLVRVMAAGINRPDLLQRAGNYPPPPGASAVLGLEIAGEVVGLGPEAVGWQVGDRVCALTNGGAYAEYCVAPAPQCLPWPHGYDRIAAAALPENLFTVWANLFELGGLGAGQTALIHGGSSGIGVTAIQLAAAFGAVTYCTVGSAEKAARCEALGAAAAINYREQDFSAEIKRLAGGRGVDVVLDMVGAPYAQRNLRCLATGGRLVIIAFLGGAKAENLDMTTIMTKRLTITGSTMRPRTTAEKGRIAQALREKIWPLLDEGRCRPVIHEVFPLAAAAQAHALMESSTHIGKIMLDVAQNS